LLDQMEHEAYGREDLITAKNLIILANEFAIQPGLPIAIKLDLDSLVARIGIDLTEVCDEGKEELLECCDNAVRRLRRIADRFGLTIHKAYSRYLMFRLSVAREGKRAYENPTLINELQVAREICEKNGLGLYKREIEQQLKKCREPVM